MSDVRARQPPETDAALAADLQERMIALVRGFGLLRPDRTPCGQPLAVSEAHAMLELSRGDGLSQGALGDRLRLEKSTVSRLVTQLADRGWLVRERDPGDGRVTRLCLTTEGRRTAGRVAAARADRYGALLERIPSPEREGVLHALGVLALAVDEADGGGRRR